MKQNLLTIQQILNSFVSLNEMISTESFNIYNFQNRKFQIGQWIDVKESSESWVIHNFNYIFSKNFEKKKLEGQIVNMNHTQILVHFYSGPHRRDEWIEINSARIAPFR